MKITRNYYDQLKEEMDAARQRCQEREEKKTPEQRAEEKLQLEKEIETFIKDVRESEQNTCFEPDEEKEADFELMCQFAMFTAQYLELNIEIDTDDKKYSTIEFTMEQLYLTENVPKEICLMLGMMFAWADETWIDRKGEMISFLFFFYINEKVVKREQ